MTSEMPAEFYPTVAPPPVPEVAWPHRTGPSVLPSPLLVPSYGGACLDSLAPALLAAPGARPDWLPGTLREAEQTVLLVLDGLGWLQLQSRGHLAPTMTSLEGGPISSVAPTTTATALTSLALGMS